MWCVRVVWIHGLCGCVWGVCVCVEYTGGIYGVCVWCGVCVRSVWM